MVVDEFIETAKHIATPQPSQLMKEFFQESKKVGMKEKQKEALLEKLLEAKSDEPLTNEDILKYSEIGQRTCCSADRDAAERMLKSTAFFRTFAFILMSDAILCISALAGNFSAGTSEGDAIRIASIALLALSLLELFTQLFVRGCSFFTNFTLLVDAAVVILALVAEVAEPTNLVIISAGPRGTHCPSFSRQLRLSREFVCDTTT